MGLAVLLQAMARLSKSERVEGERYHKLAKEEGEGEGISRLPQSWASMSPIKPKPVWNRLTAAAEPNPQILLFHSLFTFNPSPRPVHLPCKSEAGPLG
jgi:hypothetical protein